MIGIVLVSHSRKIAMGLKELLDQLTQGAVPVEAAGGVAEDVLGTDAAAVAEAIRRAQSGSGVAVLVDLGSAALSAETALDLLGEGWREQVALCDAPLVEGAVAAAVEASLGSALGDVRRSAEAAREASKL